MSNQLCPRCRKENSQAADFCTSCGAVLSQGQPRVQPQYQRGGQRPRPRVGIVAFWLGLVSLVVALVPWVAIPLEIDVGLGAFIALAVMYVPPVTAVAALLLGIMAIVQTRGRGLYAILGTVLSGAALAASSWVWWG